MYSEKKMNENINIRLTPLDMRVGVPRPGWVGRRQPQVHPAPWGQGWLVSPDEQVCDGDMGGKDMWSGSPHSEAGLRMLWK